jgi:hypothetical protein
MPSAEKIMGTVFWDAERCILINFWNLGKPSLLLIMSRHHSSFVVHCAIITPEERSFCSTVTLGLTQLI